VFDKESGIFYVPNSSANFEIGKFQFLPEKVREFQYGISTFSEGTCFGYLESLVDCPY